LTTRPVSGLLDLRKTGPFKGRGALLEAAKAEMLPVWETGSSVDVTKAMAAFRDAHEEALIAHAPVDRSDHQGGAHRSGQLPEITYDSGGLEKQDIRRQVCEILEGGEDAFKERARRLRIRM
jgi:hypothetical protein